MTVSPDGITERTSARRAAHDHRFLERIEKALEAAGIEFIRL
jgi:hypothetical protein